MPPELEGPELPDVGAHIWEWFSELHVSREGPITYREIEAWSRLTRTQIDSWEVAAIKMIDIEYLRTRNNG